MDHATSYAETGTGRQVEILKSSKPYSNTLQQDIPGVRSL